MAIAIAGYPNASPKLSQYEPTFRQQHLVAPARSRTIRPSFYLQTRMHDTSSWHKLCLWTEHSWHDFHYLQLLVDYLSLHLEHSALERASSAPTAKSTIQGIWWAILDSKTKIKWMTFTILVPEYLIGKTIGEKLAAIAGVKLMKSALVCPNETTVEQKKQIADVVYSLQWQEIHAYMANMGYFVVDFSHVLDNLNNQQAPFQTLVNAFRYDHLDDLVTHPSWIINLSRLQHRSWALNNTQLRCGLEYGLIDIPDVSSRLLTKLDRGDKLVKTLALLQITFLMTQLVARRVANYPSTQLEIATLAFSASSMITYVLYWSRPQGVESIYVMEAKKKPDDAILSMMMQYDSRYLWTHGRTESRLDEEMDLVPIRNDSSHTIYFPGIRDGWTEWIEEALGGHDEAIPLGCGAVVGGVLFGGLHCLAWDFKYPTSGEALAWKICSVLMTSLPILSIYPFIYWQRLNPRFITDTHKLSLVQIIKFLVGLVLIILLVTYILARLFLIVEIFLSLFFLPPEAFIDTWSGSFPHFTG